MLGAGETAVPRVGRGGVLSAREAKALAEARARMTEAMIPALHPLLTRFGESAERATSLLQIPRYMDLEIYTTGRHQRHLDLLLQCVEVGRQFSRRITPACIYPLYGAPCAPSKGSDYCSYVYIVFIGLKD